MRRVLTVGFSLVVLTALVAATPAVARAKRSLSLPFHTSVTLSGRTLGSHPGEHVTGHVFASARWNRGARYVVAAPATDPSGRWKITFHPSHRGDYTLRILTPDAAVFEYTFVVR
jgi:hypothetical protein